MQAYASRITTGFGINVAGYLNAESGVGEAARGYIRALQHGGIALALNNVEVAVSSRKSDHGLGDFAQNNPYPINLICVNADQVPAFVEKWGAQYFAGKYNIAVWWWELPDFPQPCFESFRWFDEIWVGSTFVQSALSKCAPIPVVCVPPSLKLPEQPLSGPEELGVPGDEFLFLFMFDFLSAFERKNPLAVVQAFRDAFTVEQPVRLVLKCINSQGAQKKLTLLKAAIGEARVTLIDRYLSARENLSLIASCDSYVSLHRSEGLGLPLAEAMLLRKPVIATGWSGNVDFTSASNSYLIPYRLVLNQEDCGPYRKGETWAEPDIDAAAAAMKEVVSNRDAAALKAAQAFIDVSAQFSPATVSAIITGRLAAIRAFHPDSALSVEEDAAPYLLDETTRQQLQIIASGASGKSDNTVKAWLRKAVMPVLEKAGYLNAVYAQLFRKLFEQYAAFKARIDLIDERSRREGARSDARLRALEDELRALKERLK